MKYQLIVNQIITKLEDHGAKTEAGHLRQISTAGYTSITELLGSILEYLTNLTKHNNVFINLIGKEVKEFRIQCQSVGIRLQR